MGAAEQSGTYAHANGVGEATGLEVTPPQVTEYDGILFDMNNLTQTTTIRVYAKVDGTNYRLMHSAVFPTDFSANTKSVWVALFQTAQMWKVTFQSSVAEGAARNVPYRYIKRRTG